MNTILLGGLPNSIAYDDVPVYLIPVALLLLFAIYEGVKKGLPVLKHWLENLYSHHKSEV